MFKRSTLTAMVVTAAAMTVPAAHAFAAVQTIADASATPTGTTVTVNNARVSAILDISPGFNNETYALQDSTGGTLAFRFALSGARDPGYHPNAGDLVNVTATNSPFGGNNELSGTAGPAPIVTFVSSGTATPDAISVLNMNNPDGIDSGFDGSGMPLDGVLVMLHNVKFDASGTIDGHETTSLGAYTVYDPSLVYVDPITGIPADPASIKTTIFFYKSYDYVGPAFDGQTLPTGLVDIVGVVTKFAAAPGGYEIYPLSISGLTAVPPPVPEPASLSLIALGAAALLRRRR